MAAVNRIGNSHSHRAGMMTQPSQIPTRQQMLILLVELELPRLGGNGHDMFGGL